MTGEQQATTLAITGGTGFIARGLIEGCAEVRLACRALSRSNRPAWAPQGTQWQTLAYDDDTAMATALTGVDFLIHLADNPSRGEARDADETQRINACLIRVAHAAGVKGVAIASSVYAREAGAAGSYGSVKRATELQFLAEPTLNPIVLRLPPVYGPGGKGGLAVLTKLVSKGLPLPFGLATEQRAYLSRRNLVSLILAMTASPAAWRDAGGEVFEPSDGQAVTTRDLIGHLARQLGKSNRLLPVPLGLLRVVAGAAGKGELVAGSLNPLKAAPVSELESAFGWRPVEQMPQSLGFLRAP